jgi:hypothetical protein
MATDIMGLLTGVSKRGIDPMNTGSFRERQLQYGAERARGLQQAVRGMLTGRAPIEQQIQEALLAKQKEQQSMVSGFSQLSPEEQKNTINALRAKGDSSSLALATQLAQQMQQERQATLSEKRIELEEEQLKAQSERLLAGDRQAIREASKASEKAGARASQLLGLADDYARLKPMGGAGGKAYSLWAKTFGTQDEVERIKTQFQSIINTDIINNLPPGVASDKDIEMAKSGFMNNSWSAEEIEQFLRGQAKLAAYAAEREDAKATWMEENQGSLAGFNSFWRDTINQEGYKEEIRQKYNLPAYDMPLPEATFDPTKAPPIPPSAKTMSVREIRNISGV